MANYKNQLETKDLILGKAKLDDLENIFNNYWCQEETAKYMLWPTQKNLIEAKDRLIRTINFQKEHLAFFIYEKSTGKAIGMAAMIEISPNVYEDGGIGLGKDYIGKGYGKQVLKCLIEYIFDELNGEKIICSCHTDNIASANLQKSCGLKYFKTIEVTREKDNLTYKSDNYQITKEDYLFQKNKETSMKKIYQCVQNANKETIVQDTIYAIKRAGFDGVFVQWYNEDLEFSQQQQVDLCRELDLDIAFAHLGYKKINDIWLDNVDGDNLVDGYLKDLDQINRNNIKMVIMHLSSKSVAPMPSKIGINRLQKIADYAQKLGIKIAFENNKIKGYLEYVFNNIKNENIGICFDSGHCHCHFDDSFDWELFKDKIFALHLHDNDKSRDQHFLPFDGTIDWEKYMNNIQSTTYNGPLTLESCYTPEYFKMSISEFYQESYNRAKKLQTYLK